MSLCLWIEVRVDRFPLVTARSRHLLPWSQAIRAAAGGNDVDDYEIGTDQSLGSAVIVARLRPD